MPAETATDSFIAEFSRRYLEHRPPSLGIGRRPAVLVVDFIEGFTNPESPLAGDWDLQVRNTAELIRAARKAVSMPVAPAQDASTYYTVMHPDEFEIDWTSFYRQAEQQTADLRAELPHHLDLAYGEDPKQRLDLYLPAGDPADAPVFLFLHGGGFQEGDRAQYGFVAEPFAEHGIVTAVASYRLTVGGHTYPAQPEDVKSAIEWLYHHVAEYGGDPAAIFVGGHSAGAILAADAGVNRSWLTDAGIPKDVLRGIVPISGAYDLRESGRAYTPTPEAEARASPMLHIGDPAPAAVVAVGSVEETYLGSSREFVEKLSGMRVSAKLLVLEGENHRDTVASLADGDSDLFRMVLEMVREYSRGNL